MVSQYDLLTAETADTMTIGNIGWEEMFSDPYLQTLIRQGPVSYTHLRRSTDSS